MRRGKSSACGLRHEYTRKDTMYFCTCSDPSSNHMIIQISSSRKIAQIFQYRTQSMDTTRTYVHLANITRTDGRKGPKLMLFAKEKYADSRENIP